MRSLPVPMPESEIQLLLKEAEVTNEKPLNYAEFVRKMVGGVHLSEH